MFFDKSFKIGGIVATRNTMQMHTATSYKDKFLDKIRASKSLDEALEMLDSLNADMDWKLFENSARKGSIAQDDLKAVGRVLLKHMESSPRNLSLFSRGLLSHLVVQLKRGEVVTIRSALAQLLPHFRANTAIL